jgi:hypothetical protein
MLVIDFINQHAVNTYGGGGERESERERERARENEKKFQLHTCWALGLGEDEFVTFQFAVLSGKGFWLPIEYVTG